MSRAAGTREGPDEAFAARLAALAHLVARRRAGAATPGPGLELAARLLREAEAWRRTSGGGDPDRRQRDLALWTGRLDATRRYLLGDAPSR